MTVEKKRKLPARAGRGEGPSKKRISITPDQQAQSPKAAVPPPVVEEPLPRSIAPGKPLPTVNEPQPENLPSSQYQSIPESGVLPESLNRSRQKWISEGIFEKYWTKVTKKKAATEQMKDNPPKESMTKLGSCTITVEPHIFEATMYVIKDTTPRPPPTNQIPMPRPSLQYGPPGGMMPPPPPTPPPAIAHPYPAQQSLPPQSPRSGDVHMNGTSPATNNQQPPSSALSSTNGAMSNGANSRPHPGPNVPPNYPPPATPASGPTPTPGFAQPPPAKTPRIDPVIQMLAERAATDADLKGLMRVVANGDATMEELSTFQRHIDELSKLQKARQAMESPKPQTTNQAQFQPSPSAANGAPPVSTPYTNGQDPSHSNYGGPHPPAAKPMPTQQPSVPATPTTHAPAFADGPVYQTPQPQALRSKGPVAASRPDISGVVFEFNGGNGDRYLFPKFSILEYPPGGNQVIASFLIIRKGSASDSPTYDPKLDYYQPITIRLYSHQPRQLEALQKVVAPAEEVRRYMDDVMEKCTRAEYVLLAMRLPKEPDMPTAVDVQPEVPQGGDRREGIQVKWMTTKTVPPPAPHPPHVKPAPRLLTEEEKYQSYIGTVAAV